MNRLLFAILLIGFGFTDSAHAEGTKKTIWQGVIHLGDSADSYPKITSAGMAFQVPFKMEAGKATRLTVTAADVETQAGNGHYVEVIAHFEKQPNKAPAKEIVVGTFRIKGKSKEDAEFAFAFNSGKNLDDRTPDYYSVRIKLDTHVGFTFWDDILVKRIDVEQ